MGHVASILIIAGLLAPRVWGGSVPSAGGDLSGLKREVVLTYARLLRAANEDSLAGVRDLQRAVAVLIGEPSEESVNAARQAWLKARVPYLQTEVSRFYDGPIDQVEGLLNAWPIDEHYIDYVAGDPEAGVINDPVHHPILSRKLLRSLNEREGEKNISTGFHAIEFLLWGQDVSANGPGDRSWRDYADGTKNAARRREYLRLVTELLVSHLETVGAAWAEGKSGNYRAEFLALDPDVALGRMLKGMGAFSGPELAGERLTVAYETKEQEEEHSCFSDSTHQDLFYDALGIQNIYLGRYRRPDGTTVRGRGVRDLLESVDPALAGRLAAQIAAGVAAVRAIPAPFDQAILGANTRPGRVAIKKAITALHGQADLITKAAAALSINLNL